MLIQALCEYADKQLPNNIPDGWEEQRIHFRIELTPDGKVANIVDVRDEVTRVNAKGKEKKIVTPRTVILPKRTQTTAIESNIIEHRPLYIFGLNYDVSGFTPDDNTNKARRSHAAFVEKNIAMFENIHSAVCDAYTAFLQDWGPEAMRDHPALAKLGKDYKTAYFGFCLEGQRDFLEEDDAFRSAYDAMIAESVDEIQTEENIVCSILGESLPPARIHEQIKCFPGGKSTGSVLVGINEAAFESYGKTQAYGCNVSKKAMEKYVRTMNALISDKMHCKTIDGLVLMYFAMKSDDSVECGMFSELFEQADAKEQAADDIVRKADSDLNAVMTQTISGTATEESTRHFDKDAMFYVVGMSPNGPRICQKFIWKDHFGNIVHNLQQHQKDMQIGNNNKPISFYKIKYQLVSPKSSSDKVPPPLTASLVTAAMNGTPYPAALLSTIINRVKTDDMPINDIRAGIIKACLNRKSRMQTQKEEIQMAWDETNKNPAYLCGSLFAVYEKLQKQAAAPAKLNRTIRDSYFSSACSRPNTIMPRLEKLSQNHMKKVSSKSEGTAIYYQKLVNTLMENLDGAFPSTLSLDDQGRFIVGYHQMNQKLYAKNTTDQED